VATKKDTDTNKTPRLRKDGVTPYKDKAKRSAAQVLASNNHLVLTKMIREGVIPDARVAELVQEFMPALFGKKE
jgi:hypothetical protein